ncbi:MAG: DUF6746 family protein [Verrucomicrobiota bacterium]
MKTSPLPIFVASIALAFGASLTSCEKPDSGEAEATVAAETAEAPEKKEEGAKPMKHLDIPDVTSYDEAKKVFLERVAEITGKNKLDNQELHEIHMSTYHLEKAVAYFAENSEGPKKEAAEKLAVVVEEVHLSSETFKPEEAKKHLAEFAKQAKAFTAGLE